MIMKKTFRFATLLPLLLTAGNTALADIGFRPLEVFKFKNGIARLASRDLDRDGFDDLVFLNNRDSRIEVLFSMESSEAAGKMPDLKDRFFNAGMIADQYVRDVEIKDLDADGLEDLITVGAEQGLHIHYQRKARVFSEPVRIFIQNPEAVFSIKTADLDNDQRPDIFLLYREKAEILWNDKDQAFSERSTIRFAKENAGYAELIAADDDAHIDLLVYFNENHTPLSIFKGQSGRSFSAEHPLILPDRSFVHSLAASGDPRQIGMVLKNRSGYRLYRIQETERPDPQQTAQTTVRRVALDTTETARVAPWVSGDFNKDGFDDFISSAPQLSQLHLYQGTADGLAPQPRRFDTLSGVSSLKTLSNGDLLVVSQTEKAAGRHTALDYAAFPALIPTGGDVLAGTADELDRLYFICKKNSSLTLEVHPPSGRVQSIPLTLKNDPSQILAFGISEEETGLLLFVPYEKPQMFILNGKKLTAVDAARFPALNRELKSENFLFEPDGSGRRITVAADRTARIYEWNGSAYTVQKQINPESERAVLKTLTRSGDALVLYDENSTSLLFSYPDNTLHRLLLHNPPTAVSALTALARTNRQAMVLISPNALSEVINGHSYELTAESEYTTQAKDPVLSYAIPVTLGAKQNMIAVVDSANSTLELLEPRENKLEAVQTIKVFETPQLVDTSKSRGVEPHDIASGDLNGDGIFDLALLCHDRLLLYFGE